MHNHLLIGLATGFTALLLIYGIAVAFWVYLILLPLVFLACVLDEICRGRPWWRNDKTQ